MRTLTFYPLIAASSVVLAGCVSPRPVDNENSASLVVRTYIEQQAKFEELRAELAPIVRQLSMAIPVDCDIALAKITDQRVQATLLELAAVGGIFAAMRLNAPDPRVGLIQLMLSATSLRRSLSAIAATGPYPALDPMISSLDSVLVDFNRLGNKWLSPEVLQQVSETREKMKSDASIPLGELLKANQIPATKFLLPRSIEIDSSFIQFNDNGMLERGVGEIHAMRLSLQQASDVLAQIPQSLEYRMRRAALETLMLPDAVVMREDFKQIALQVQELKNLRQLQHLDSLAKLDSLQQIDSLKDLNSLHALDNLIFFRWFVVASLAIGLSVQGLLVAWAIRRVAGK